MFNLFNESSILPTDAVRLEKNIAKQIASSTEFKLLCIRCESIPSTPTKYNVLIGDTVYSLARELSEKFEGDLDCITNLKFSEAFNKTAESRTLPISRDLIEHTHITKKQMLCLWRHDMNMVRMLLKELNAIKKMALN